MDKNSDELNIEKDLERGLEDYAHSGVKAGLSTTPVIGGALAEFFEVVVAPPLQKRRDEWLIRIYKRLLRLEKVIENFDIKNLVKNENFISILFQATSVAMRTHQEEKLEALANAVTNAAGSPKIDDNLQLIFLSLIDRYTPWHLILLEFLKDPKAYGEKHGINYPDWSQGSTGTVIESTFPALKNQVEFYELIVREMISNGLLQEGIYLRGAMTPSGMFASRITKLGVAFLEFIQSSG